MTYVFTFDPLIFAVLNEKCVLEEKGKNMNCVDVILIFQMLFLRFSMNIL